MPLNLDTTTERIVYVGLFAAVAVFVIGAVIAWLSWYIPATTGGVRDTQPTPGLNGEPAEPDDFGRLSNPATRHGSGVTPAQIAAKLREGAEALDAARLYPPEPVYLPEQPDELDDAGGDLEEAEPADEEQPEPAPGVVDASPAPFVIQGEPTEPAALFAAGGDLPIADPNWFRSGMTSVGAYTLEDLADEIARHDAAERPWERVMA